MSTKATAYHEAGHVVIGYHLGLRLGKRGVSIISDGDSLGRADVPFTFHNSPEFDKSDRMRLQIERQVICFLAGGEAQRRFNPRSVRNYHASADYQYSVNLLSYVFYGPDELSAYVRFLQIRTRNIVALKHTWVQITAIAEGLLQRKHLSRDEAENIMSAAVQKAVQKRTE